MAKKTGKVAKDSPATTIRRFGAIAAFVLVVLLLVVAAWLATRPAATPVPTSTRTATTVVQARTPTSTAVPLPTVAPGQHVERVKGSPSAKVTVIEYSDFQCPYCSAFAVQVYPQIETKYVQTGQVRWIFRPLVLSYHRQAQKAAESAECAGDQNKYWEMHDLIFARQTQWADKTTAVDLFKGYARSLGLDEAAFASCLDGSKYRAVPAENDVLADKAGVTGTPTYFVNGLKVGAAPFDEFSKYIDQELAK